MKIKWAPLSVPMRRKRILEVFSAFTFIMIVLFSELVTIIIYGSIFVYGGIFWKTACLAYLLHFYLDRNAHENCSRGQGYEFLRGWRVWKYFANYFPLALVKTVELPATKNYIFACFPHGVISCSGFGHFVTSGTNFRELFPKIRSKLCTLNYHFFVPVFREIALGWGMISAKQSNIRFALNQSNEETAPCNADGYTSNAIILMVGGAQEALNSRPGVYKLVLNNRKGFVKIALQAGASLVPVFSFNEVEVYDIPSNEVGTRLRTFQEFCKKLTGIAPAFFIGRGFFQYSFGLIPRRHQITTVVGRPIDTQQTLAPSEEQINKVHKKFIEDLEKLFEENKGKYIKNADKTRLIIE